MALSFPVIPRPAVPGNMKESKVKDLISKLTKEELIHLVITLAWYRPFELRKEIKGSLARRDKLYAQYEAQRRSEQADEKEVAE